MKVLYVLFAVTGFMFTFNNPTGLDAQCRNGQCGARAQAPAAAITAPAFQRAPRVRQASTTSVAATAVEEDEPPITLASNQVSQLLTTGQPLQQTQRSSCGSGGCGQSGCGSGGCSGGGRRGRRR